MEKTQVVVVGAGLAGLATAYVLSSAGIEVLVLERGEYPGSKNVTGGRVYLNPVRSLLPDLLDQAPFERHVVKEKLTIMSDASSTTFELFSSKANVKPYPSHTVLRAKFDRWLADKVKERGGSVVSKSKVDEPVIKEGRVAGVVVGGAEILADVVVAADGALSFMAEKAGLRGRHEPKDFAVGIKEVIELPRSIIDGRFGLEGDEGCAQLFFGSITKGMMGGGFLYTNLESLSLGLVVGIRAMMDKEPPVDAFNLLEEFKRRKEIEVLVEGGDLVEYSAHTIPEGGVGAMPRLYSNGILVVGDAAGLALNMGVTVRGMDFALASGAIAAEAIKRATKANDFSARSLSYYEELLRKSFILRDMGTFGNVVNILNTPRVLNTYPQAICDLFEALMWIDEKPKEKLSSTFLRAMRRNFLTLSGLRDILRLLRI